MSKRVKYQLLRNYFYYNTQELVSVLGVSKSTVRNWVRSGLTSIKSGNKGPYYFGNDVKEFLKKRRAKSKMKTGKGEAPCFSCKKGRKLITSSIELIETGKILGNKGTAQIQIKGICKTCGANCIKGSSSNKVGEFLSHYPEYQNNMMQFKQATETDRHRNSGINYTIIFRNAHRLSSRMKSGLLMGLSPEGKSRMRKNLLWIR